MITVFRDFNSELNECSNGSWLQHWEKFSGRNASYCADCNCLYSENLVGAIVTLRTHRSDHFVVPLCPYHYSETGSIQICDSSVLVLAKRKRPLRKKKEQVIDELFAIQV